MVRVRSPRIIWIKFARGIKRRRWNIAIFFILFVLIALALWLPEKVEKEPVRPRTKKPTPNIESCLWGMYDHDSPWQKRLYKELRKDIRWGLEPAKIDLSKMIFIPEGKALIGAYEHPHGNELRLRLKTRYVKSFYIDQAEVTNGDYARCVNEKMCLPALGTGYCEECDKPDHPALLPYFGARRYCLWAGKRLPLENEWEKAARGTDGRSYPWGKELPDETRGNICGTECTATTAMSDWKDIFRFTAPVGSFPEGDSPYGLTDVAGNVKEWVNPKTPLLGNQRIARGGSWYSRRVEMLTFYRQIWVPGVRLDDKGVRCAADFP